MALPVELLKADARLPAARDALRSVSPCVPTVGVVLGSGLGNFCEALSDRVEIPFADIPGMPVARVSGHAGTWCFGTTAGIPVLCQRGRVHLYEGRSTDDAVFGARLLAAMGCETVLLTNAAGGIAPSLAPGDLMLITDHINLTSRNPLVGQDNAFIDMTQVYDSAVADAARVAARAEGIELKQGVYAGLLGPTYETPAEVRMLRTLGADAVGMSTVNEAIALRHAEVSLGAVSCITNVAAMLGGERLTHEEVKQQAARANSRFCALLRRWIHELGGTQ